MIDMNVYHNLINIKLIRNGEYDMNELMDLKKIVEKFSESQWDVLDQPSKKWLEATTELLQAIQAADEVCGQCGCEFDELYKKALGILNGSFKTDSI